MAGGRIPATGQVVIIPGTLRSEDKTTKHRRRQGDILNSGSLRLRFDYDAQNNNTGRFSMCADGEIASLFRAGRSPTIGLSEEDYQAAASSLGVEVAAIMAVAEVETSGKAFDELSRPRILYERHYFHRLTFGKYSTAHPDISNSAAGGYGLFAAQYGKLERAYELDSDAALRSASWGRFQIMGDNYRAAGFASVNEFVLAMARAESEHLKAFSTFVGKNKTMLTALRNKDWPAFAAAYNGPGYKKNNYDKKMEDAYNRYKTVQTSTATRIP